MRIVEVCPYELYKNYSSSFVHQQAKALVGLGHKVRMIILIPFGKSVEGFRFFPLLWTKIQDDVEIVYLRYLSLSNFGSRFFNNIGMAIALEQYKKRMSRSFIPDVNCVHTMNYAFSGKVLKWQNRKPLFLVVHGSDLSVPYYRGMFSEIKTKCRKIDCVITVSSMLSNMIGKVDKNIRVVTVNNGYTPSNRDTHISKEGSTWIQVGHLIESKKYDTTIAAFSRCLNKGIASHLTIIGEGPEEKKLKALVKDYNIERYVTFIRKLDNSDVLKHMDLAEYFVMVSYPEGLGIVYLEAMSSGCITIGTQGEGIEDIIVDGKNGFLVQRDDVDTVVSIIEKCENNNTLKESISMNARNSTETMTWETNARKCENIFSNYTMERMIDDAE